MVVKEIKLLDKNNERLGKIKLKEETVNEIKENSNEQIIAKLKVKILYSHEEDEIYVFEMITDKFSCRFEIDEEKAKELRRWLANEN